MNGVGTSAGDQNVYKGIFRDNNFEGIGWGKTSDHQYLGQWKNGDHHGKGILTLTDGEVSKGLFKDGLFKLAFDFNEGDLIN